MTNEEFQRIVLEEFKKLNEKVGNLEKGQEEIKKDLKAVIEENEIIKEISGRHEIDIRRIKRRIV